MIQQSSASTHFSSQHSHCDSCAGVIRRGCMGSFCSRHVYITHFSSFLKKTFYSVGLCSLLVYSGLCHICIACIVLYCMLQVTEQHPTSGLWKGFRCTTSGLMTRPGYFPATAVVLIDPQSELSQCLLYTPFSHKKQPLYFLS